MVVVKNHHEVLEHWADYRRRRPQAPLLLTLDHHTDTSPAFRLYLKEFRQTPQEFIRRQKNLLSSMNFQNAQSIRQGIQNLAHDEHITAALSADIISSAFVIAQNAVDTDGAVYEQHKICCFAAFRDQNKSLSKENQLDLLLESEFLQQAFAHFSKVSSPFRSIETFILHDYILDIDLDYLNTCKSVEPENSVFLKTLAEHAGLITVAREDRHVLMCAKDSALTADYLLEKLKLLLI
jgi:hypothetical protein